jgi:hypothetical protein
MDRPDKKKFWQNADKSETEWKTNFQINFFFLLEFFGARTFYQLGLLLRKFPF